MENIKWNSAQKEEKAGRFFNMNDIFIPETITQEKVNVESILLHLEESISLPYSLKEIDETTSSLPDKAFLITEHAAQFVVLAHFYKYAIAWGKYKHPQITYIKPLTTNGNGLLDIRPSGPSSPVKEWEERIRCEIANYCGVKSLEQPEKDWTIRLNKKTGKTRHELTQFFEKQIVLKCESAEYFGKMVEFHFNQSNTVKEFRTEFQNTFHVIPDIFIKGKTASENVTLKELGIIGEQVVKLPPTSSLFRLMAAFRDFSFDVWMRYEARPWAYVNGDTLLTKVGILPSILDSIKTTLLIIFAAKYSDKVEKL